MNRTLIVIFSVVLVGGTIFGSCRSAPVPVDASSNGYIGSPACARCHQEYYDGWRKTYHPIQEQPASPSTVIGDFGNAVLESGTRRVRMSRAGDAFIVTIAGPDGKDHDYPVIRTIGNLYKQRYVTRIGDGEFVFPIEWNVAEGKWQEFHGGLRKHPPGDGSFWAAPSMGWERSCAGCHVTGLSPAISGDRGKATFVELGIGCESCHGPGRAHVERPATAGLIANPAKMDRRRAAMVCAQCHSRGTGGGRTAYPDNYRPGEDIDRSFTLLTQADPSAADAFWPDGSSRKHHQQYNDFLGSPHDDPGRMSCMDCHESHGRRRYGMLRRDPRDNTLCLTCHKTYATSERLTLHTRHSPENEGSICINCHMPKLVVNAAPHQLRSHRFRSPDPAAAERTKTPSACVLCHSGRDEPWAAAAIDRWHNVK